MYAGETYGYELTQPGRRRCYNVRDQWGRKWLAVVEIKTGDPITMVPCFTDALQTPLKYITIPKDAPNTCEIDYAPWIDELVVAREVYENRREDITRALHGDMADLDKPPTREIMRIIGKQPIAVERVQLAAAGDRKALGIRGKGLVKPRPKVKTEPEPEYEDESPAGRAPAGSTAEE